MVVHQGGTGRASGGDMIVDHRSTTRRTTHAVDPRRFPLHAEAVDRHMSWAFDLAAAGDQDLAESALRDVLALVAEVVDPDDRRDA